MAHPDVREAAVVAIPDDRFTERPLACIVTAPEADLTMDALHVHLEPRVAKWWIPESFTFIDEVPKTSVGKSTRRCFVNGSPTA